MRCLALFLALSAVTLPALSASPLPHYRVEPGTAAVAGVSSGGFLAVQLHVAYSATFTRGAAVFAGGPYDCAEGSALRATTVCMKAVPAAPDPEESVRRTDQRAQSGLIDPVANLAKSRVYLFSGQKDIVIRPPVVDALYAYYRHYLPAESIAYQNTTAASHGWVSPLAPQACDALGKYFLNNCGLDTAQAFLTQFYGTLAPKNTGSVLRGSLVEFDQKEFFADRDPHAHSVADSGWAFVPAECAAGQPCKLVVALHGCLQDYQKVGDAFIRRSGLNEWADTNRIVVLYPQAISRLANNPNGCWDWWGYDDPGYATRDGRQMRAIKSMVDRVMTAAR